MRTRNQWRDVWLALPVALSALIFYPILRNYFFGDDLYFIYRIVDASFIDYLLKPYGGHLYVARNFALYLCYQVFGTDPRGCFALVLATHLLNVALLYRVLHLLLHRPRLAAFGAALWGSAPLHEGTLGWYTVYGNVMVGTVTLVLLYDLARTRRAYPLGARHLLQWSVLLFIACTSFGNGLALALVFPLLVLLIHPSGPGKARALLYATVVAMAVLPTYFAVYRLLTTPEEVAIATVTLNVGTLTNWRPLLAMLGDLVGYGLFLLWLREASSLIAYTSPIGLALIGIVLITLGVAFVRGDGRTRGLLLAGVALALATYAAVAAGRGALWGRNFFLATRYQYVPSIGVVMALCAALAALQSRKMFAARVTNAGFAAWLIAAIALRLTLSAGIDHHHHARKATDTEIKEMWRLIRTSPTGGDVYIQNRIFHGVGPMMIRNPKMFPGWAAAFTIFFPSNVVEGRRVFFVEPDPEVRDATRNGKRTATLIVAP